MKPKFGWVFFIFIVSMALLVSFSILFYQQFRILANMNNRLQHNFEVFYQLRDLKQIVTEAESNTRGFIITRDSGFISRFPQLRDRVQIRVDSLKSLMDPESAQYRSLILMNVNLTQLVNSLTRNIQQIQMNDSSGLHESLVNSQTWMHRFVNDIEEMENKEYGETIKLREIIKDQESSAPDYFNVALIFSGLLTLVSFFFVIREMRMRFKYQDELELRLNELNRSTAELEQFTYVASHDLQEPLRKIRTFSGRLVMKNKGTLSGEGELILERIDVAAQRMQDMIQDMVNFTNLVNRHELPEKVDLNRVIQHLLKKMHEAIREKNAMIIHEELPVIHGFRDQLILLFRALMDNSLKFSSSNRRCEIRITSQKIEGKDIGDSKVQGKKHYYQVKVEDNGIGFNNEFASRIFMIFQRLHNQESPYRGKGIGLAIAQRVMTNHNGMIMATGDPEKGATISMYFPVGS